MARDREKSGYYTRLIQHAHRFNRQGMKSIIFYKNLMGTTFDVYRLKDQSKAKLAYGASHLHSTIFSSGVADVPEYDRSEYDYKGEVILVFPLSDMHSFYEYQSIGSVEVIDNESTLEIGDELTTTYNGKLMLFKVESKENYGEHKDTATRYTIAFRRILNTQNE